MALSARAGASAQRRCPSDVLSRAGPRPTACAALRAPHRRVAPRTAAPRTGSRAESFRVFALDAAQPFDYEAVARRRVEAERSAADKLLIGACPRAASGTLRACACLVGSAGCVWRKERREGGLSASTGAR